MLASLLTGVGRCSTATWVVVIINKVFIKREILSVKIIHSANTHTHTHTHTHTIHTSILTVQKLDWHTAQKGQQTDLRQHNWKESSTETNHRYSPRHPHLSLWTMRSKCHKLSFDTDTETKSKKRGWLLFSEENRHVIVTPTFFKSLDPKTTELNPKQINVLVLQFFLTV